jgi:predicted Zn-dependent protease
MFLLRPRTASIMLAFGLCFVGILVVISGCQTVPGTGRRQLLTISEAEENRMGLTAYKDVLEKEPLTENTRYKELVERVGQRIAAVANRPDFDWEFSVIESDTQNAFCLPGGKVAVYTGMLPVCQTEAGLAVVMSHEVAHAIARHGGERMSHKMVQNLGQSGLARLTKGQSEGKQQIFLAAYGGLAEYGAILPYSRKHELEADEIGIMLMAEAGYDPSAAPEFWERFAEIKGAGGPMEFMSTHPSDARRSATLREKLPQAMQVYQAAPEKFELGEAIDKES